MKVLISLLFMMVNPAVFAAPLAVQQRVADAYVNGRYDWTDLAKADLRGDVRARVAAFEGTQEMILDYWRAELDDGGPALNMIYLEFQLSDGSGGVEAYERNGRFIVRGTFHEFQPLIWEFTP